MKIPWGKILRIAVELAIDAIRGKLERKTEPAIPLPHADSARQSKFAREAGKHGTVGPATTPRGGPHQTGRR